MIDALIFSRNRPLQLNCLLSSLKENSNVSENKITVLHHYDDEYSEGFQEVKNIHGGVNFIEEEDFEAQVKNYLKKEDQYCVFFVDDIIVKDQINFEIPCKVLEVNPDILCFSMRLGLHLVECYPAASSQIVPNGTISSQMFVWKWMGSSFDWGYPLSVDGHIFRRSELEGWISHLKFKNPNQFESAMQEIPRIFVLSQGMVCHINSKIFNNPANRVQDEFKNRSESSVSTKELNAIWLSGQEIDYSIYKSWSNPAAHTPVEFQLKKRQ
jgi:hypothetical protein